MTNANIAAQEKTYSNLPDTKFDDKTNLQADHAMRELDRVLRWKKVHKLLRSTNRRARKEQDQVAKECAEVRAEKIYSKTKTKTMGLRFGVAIPPMTWDALVLADRIACGKSELAEPDKEGYELGLKATNQIVKDLEKAFPQYKVS